MDEIQARLEDAILCGDAARAAGLVLPNPLEEREATFGPTLARITAVLCDYPEDVHAALRLICAVCTDDAVTAAVDLGEQAVATVNQEIIRLSLADRFSTWIAELIWQLSDDVRDYTDHRLVIIETLCTEWDLPRPSTRKYLFTLASALGAADAASADGALRRLLVDDPGMCALIPALLAQPGVGDVLMHGTWASAITEACDAGLIDRDSLLDLVLDPRSDEPTQSLDWFVGLHVRLAPTNAEMVARLDAYLRLIGDPRPEVVAMVLTTLFERNARTPLPIELLTATTSTLLTADDVSPGLRLLEWLPKQARSRPELTGPLALAISDGFSHENRYLVERAVATILVLLSLSGRSALKRVADPLRHACRTLSPAQAAPILNALPAAATPESETESAAPATRVKRRRHRSEPRILIEEQLPRPVRSLTELVTICEEFLHSQDPMLAEFVLDGIAAVAARDLGQTRAALTPLVPLLEQACETGPERDAGRWLGAHPVLAMLAVLVLPETSPLHSVSWRVPAGPVGSLTLRTQEVLSRVQAGQGQQLLSLPTGRTGVIEPMVLAQRVAHLAELGGSAWPMDIEQALLRANSTDIDPQVFAALSAIASPVARTVEHGLRRDLIARPAIRVEFPDGNPVVSATHAGPGWGPLSRHAFVIAKLGTAPAGSALSVLLALPHHRELAAAYLVGPLSTPGTRPCLDDLQALALLGRAAGRTHAATELALLYGAALPQADDRMAAVASLTALAARGFDADGCAATWGKRVAADQRLNLTALSATLREVAAAPHGQRCCALLSRAVLRAVDTPRVGLDEIREIADSTRSVVTRVPLQRGRTATGVG